MSGDLAAVGAVRNTHGYCLVLLSEGLQSLATLFRDGQEEAFLKLHAPLLALPILVVVAGSFTSDFTKGCASYPDDCLT